MPRPIAVSRNAGSSVVCGVGMAVPSPFAERIATRRNHAAPFKSLMKQHGFNRFIHSRSHRQMTPVRP
ncbi:hypothetical protein PPMP20_21845 [Paraburkholderia phymatum]|uniref:hypothetical protein n=1 Tax=Paraburkholderia phymatum TaxID=148447 RepID=UPI00031E5EC5|nr:hypothetical protein [Paraburkholderia phymatum]